MMPSFRVRPYGQSKMPAFDEVSKKMAELCRSFDEIFLNRSVQLSYEQLYRCAYNTVLQNHGAMLYEGLRKCINNHLLSNVMTRLAQTPDNAYLAALQDELLSFHTSLTMVRDVCMYLERVYCPGHNMPTVLDCGYVIFVDTILQSPVSRQRLQGILNSEHEEPPVDTILLRDIIAFALKGRTMREGEFDTLCENHRAAVMSRLDRILEPLEWLEALCLWCRELPDEVVLFAKHAGFVMKEDPKAMFPMKMVKSMLKSEVDAAKLHEGIARFFMRNSSCEVSAETDPLKRLIKVFRTNLNSAEWKSFFWGVQVSYAESQERGKSTLLDESMKHDSIDNQFDGWMQYSKFLIARLSQPPSYMPKPCYLPDSYLWNCKAALEAVLLERQAAKMVKLVRWSRCHRPHSSSSLSPITQLVSIQAGPVMTILNFLDSVDQNSFAASCWMLRKYHLRCPKPNSDRRVSHNLIANVNRADAAHKFCMSSGRPRMSIRRATGIWRTGEEYLYIPMLELDPTAVPTYEAINYRPIRHVSQDKMHASSRR